MRRIRVDEEQRYAVGYHERRHPPTPFAVLIELGRSGLLHHERGTPHPAVGIGFESLQRQHGRGRNAQRRALALRAGSEGLRDVRGGMTGVLVSKTWVPDYHAWTEGQDLLSRHGGSCDVASDSVHLHLARSLRRPPPWPTWCARAR